MPNDFDQWNKLKQELESSETELGIFPKEGEVWMSHLGRNIGSEQNGGGSDFSRPVLTIKKFNNRLLWFIPLSTKQKDLDFYFNYIDPNGEKVSAILAQMKLISLKRLKRKLYEIDAGTLEEIRIKLRSFL